MGRGERTTANRSAADPSMEAAANLQGQDGCDASEVDHKVDESAKGLKKHLRS